MERGEERGEESGEGREEGTRSYGRAPIVESDRLDKIAFTGSTEVSGERRGEGRGEGRGKRGGDTVLRSGHLL